MKHRIALILTLAFITATAAVSAKPPENPGGKSQAICKITYKNCALSVDANSSLTITDGALNSASVKIQLFKKFPKNITLNDDGISTETPGVVYLTALAIPEIIILGDLGKLMTWAPIGVLRSDGALRTVTGKDGHIETIAVGKIDFIKMAGQADYTKDEYATASILTEQTGAIKIHLTGVVLENLLTLQDIKSLKTDTKKYNNKITKEKGTSLGGIGRLTPLAIADTDTTYTLSAPSVQKIATHGASIAPDLLDVAGAINRIDARSAKYKGVTLGGVIGDADNPTSSCLQAANMQSIYGSVGVHCKLIAGVGADGKPDYSGTIGKIAVKPRTGALSGEAHVKETPKGILFKPDQGDFVVYYAAAP